MVAIPESLVERVKRTIATYDLFEKERRIIIALSGGKDSLTLLRILQLLGYECIPVAIDMGYVEGWSDRLHDLSRAVGAEVNVISVRSSTFQSALHESTRVGLQSRLNILDNFGHGADSTNSPCTQCYNTKITALREIAQSSGILHIAFGHHATDAISSLLKSALMFVDRWDREHAAWDRLAFERLVEELWSEIASGDPCTPLIARIRELVAAGSAATDEPPLQLLESSLGQLRIVRPLFDVFEHEIVSVQQANRFISEPSGCGHGATRDHETPREMIQFRIVRNVVMLPQGGGHLDEFCDWTRAGLRPDGQLVINVRNKRAELLGSAYRSGSEPKL